VIWNETLQKRSNLSGRLTARRNSATKPPPLKRRKADGDASKEDPPERKKSGGGDRSCVDPGDAVCFVLISSPPPLPGHGGTVVLLCRVRERAGMCRTYSEELSRVKLEIGCMCRGDLDIDKKGLDLWQGGFRRKGCCASILGVHQPDRCVSVVFSTGGQVIAARHGRTYLSVKDFSLSGTRSLACLLAFHCLTQVSEEGAAVVSGIVHFLYSNETLFQITEMRQPVINFTGPCDL